MIYPFINGLCFNWMIPNLYMEICCLTNSIHLKLVVWSCKIWIVWLPHVQSWLFEGWKSILPTTFLFGNFENDIPVRILNPPLETPDPPVQGLKQGPFDTKNDIPRILRVQRENHTKQFMKFYDLCFPMWINTHLTYGPVLSPACEATRELVHWSMGDFALIYKSWRYLPCIWWCHWNFLTQKRMFINAVLFIKSKAHDQITIDSQTHFLKDSGKWIHWPESHRTLLLCVTVNQNCGLQWNRQ